MNKSIFKISGNVRLTPGTDRGMSVWKMCLSGDTSGITAPGQFVNLALPGRYLRRPISVCDRNGNTVTIIYRVVGQGTLDLSALQPGDEIEMLTGLGNGFSTSGNHPLLAGGGVGLPPMLFLAKEYLSQGKHPQVVAGFNTSSDVILCEEFRKIGVNVTVCTMDGSLGIRGTVMEAIRDLDFDFFHACGPRPMLKALSELPQRGEISVEERMGCGYGVCMGCSCKTTRGMKRVCKDGPVFKKEDMIW